MISDTIIERIEEWQIPLYNASDPWCSGSTDYTEAMPSAGHLTILMMEMSNARRQFRKPICGQELHAQCLAEFRKMRPEQMVCEIETITNYLIRKGINL